MRRAVPVLFGLLLGCHATSTAKPDPVNTFAKTVDEFYWGTLETWPTWGVSLGHHQYDGRLPDTSGAALSRQLGWLRQSQAAIRSYERTALSPIEQIEQDFLLQEIRGSLFELEVNRSPWRNPMTYLHALSLTGYISRDYASVSERAQGIIGIGHATDRYLEQARQNLEDNLPKTWIETALLQVNGLIEFVASGGDVRTEMKALEEDQTKALAQALDHMEVALKKHRSFLESRKETATDDFALGKQHFLQMLRDTQGVDIDLERLEAIGQADLKRNLEALEAATRTLAPSKPTREVVQMVMSEKPDANAVLKMAGAQSADLRQFVLDHDIASIPFDDVALVRESPPFMRYNAAFLDPAGIFEKKALPSFYYISPPDPTWPKEKQVGYLPARVDLFYISVHELWPGHFLHSLHIKKQTSKVLRSFWNYAMGEGWAHYTEEMMWQANVAPGEERNHIGQLLNALLRNVRFVCAIGLHTKGMTVDECERLFVEKAFQDEGNAQQQAARGTFDPMYLSYTLGKLMILKLRDDWKKKVGDAYSLKTFHDRFLSYGAPPVPVIRRAMLGPDSGPVL